MSYIEWGKGLKTLREGSGSNAVLWGKLPMPALFVKTIVWYDVAGQEGIRGRVFFFSCFNYTTMEERFAKAPTEAPIVPIRPRRWRTDAGRKFYALRKSTVEPVFGIIKEIMWFRRFMLRGLNAVQDGWRWCAWHSI